MYVTAIHLDRFGRHSELRLDSLCEGLNVVFGSPGSGKGTLVDFLRAMWQGFDQTIRDRYLPRESRGFGGVLTIETSDGTQTFSRYDDGSHDGRLTVQREDGSVIGGKQLQMLKGRVSANLLDRAFLVDFDRRPSLAALLDAAFHENLHPEAAVISTRLQHAEKLLMQKRAELNDRNPLDSRERLLELQQQLLREIAARRNRPDQAAWDRQLLAAEEQSIRLRRDLEQLQSARRRLAGSSFSAAADVVPHSIEGEHAGRQELRELEGEIARCKQTLRDVLARKRQACAVIDKKLESRPVRNPGRCSVAIEAGLERVNEVLSRSEQNNSVGVQQLRSEVRDLLASVRGDVRDLRHSLEDRRRRQRRLHAVARKEQLSRCEVELRESLRSLKARRRQLRQRLSRLASSGGEPRLELNHGIHDADELVRIDSAAARTQRELDSVLRLAAECRERLQTPGLSHDERLETLRARLSKVESSLRDDEQRHTLICEITKLEDECRQLREWKLSCPFVADASRYLNRLSAGDWCRIHVSSATDVSVEDSHGRKTAYAELDAGARDQVYLAFCLATAGACAKGGFHFPLVLNAAFTNYPSKHVHDALGVLREFAVGKQVFCLTRHEHVVSESRLLNVPVHTLPADRRDESETRRQVSLSSHRPDARILEAAAVSRAKPIRAEQWDAQEFPAEYSDRSRDTSRRAMPSDQIIVENDKPDSDELLGQSARKELAVAVQQSTMVASMFDRLSDVYSAGASTPVSMFHLHEHDALDRAPSIDAANAARLRDLGVMRIGDLLRVDPSEISAELQACGVSLEMVNAWRAQARLMCRVPGLRSYDARILVACGLTDPEQLRSMSSSALRARVRTFAQSVEGQTILLSGTEEELSRVTDWIRSDHDNRRGATEHEQVATAGDSDGAASESNAADDTEAADAKPRGRRRKSGSHSRSSKNAA